MQHCPAFRRPHQASIRTCRPHRVCRRRHRAPCRRPCPTTCTAIVIRTRLSGRPAAASVRRTRIRPPAALHHHTRPDTHRQPTRNCLRRQPRLPRSKANRPDRHTTSAVSYKMQHQLPQTVDIVKFHHRDRARCLASAPVHGQFPKKPRRFGNNTIHRIRTNTAMRRVAAAPRTTILRRAHGRSHRRMRHDAR